MAYIPYGYRIEKGRAIIDPEQAEKIRKLVNSYLSGQSQRAAAKEAGITLSNDTVKHILDGKVYLGTDFYPAILTKKEHERIAEKRAARTHPGNAVASKPYPASYRFRLYVSEEAVHPDMNRDETIEALYRLLEPSEFGRKSASDEESVWIRECLSNCAPMPENSSLPYSAEDRQQASSKEQQLCEIERVKHTRCEYVRELRVRLGYSRRRFAAELGVSDSSLFLIENDKMAVSNKMMERIKSRFPEETGI